MLARTPPEIIADRFESRALEMVDVIHGTWSSETHRKLAASFIAGCLAYEYERGYGIGRSDGIAWQPKFFKE